MCVCVCVLRGASAGKHLSPSVDLGEQVRQGRFALRQLAALAVEGAAAPCRVCLRLLERDLEASAHTVLLTLGGLELPCQELRSASHLRLLFQQLCGRLGHLLQFCL